MRLLLILVLIVQTELLVGCSCSYNFFSISSIVNSDIFIKGKIESKRNVSIDKNGLVEEGEQTIQLDEYFEYTIRVLEYLNGDLSEKKVKVYTYISGPTCGVGLALGEDYYLEAYHNTKGLLFINSCMIYFKASLEQNLFNDVLDIYYEYNGYREWKDISGDVVAKGVLINKKPQGLWKFYDDDKLIFEGTFKDGKKNGVWNYYRKSYLVQQIYINGKFIRKIDF